MDERGMTASHAFRVERYLWAVLAAWAGVVALSVMWNARQVRRDTLELARLQARVGYQKDVLYRRWNANRGPVYVAENEETAANPYLSGVPERDIATPSGKRLTMVNPAYMTRQVHEMTERESGVRGHITSLNPVRPGNAADPWETKALKAVASGQAEVSSVEKMDGRDYMRLLRPLVTESGCLKCHAGQGYRLGDIRGGISVSIPMDPLWAVARKYLATLTVGHLLIWLVGVGGIAVGGQRLRASRDAIEVKNLQLAQRSRELQEAYDALDREFRSVGDVQVSLLPARVPDIPGFEGATHYRPARRAGGDYFDLIALPDGQWGVLVADVSGHGAPAAVVMAMTHVILHLASQKTPAAHVLQYLGEALSRDIQPDQFVTCCYGILNPRTRTFAFASAAHPEPLLFDSSSGTVRACAVEGGLPLSVDAAEQYAGTSITLEAGDVLLLYTDGITEAQNAEGQEFGVARLMAVLEAHGAEGAAHIRDAVLAAVADHRGPVELADDITLVILGARAPGE